MYIDVKVAVLLGSVAGAAAEALEKAAGAQTCPAHSPTGTALRGEGRGEEGEREPHREGGEGKRETGRRRYGERRYACAGKKGEEEDGRRMEGLWLRRWKGILQGSRSGVEVNSMETFVNDEGGLRREDRQCRRERNKGGGGGKRQKKNKKRM